MTEGYQIIYIDMDIDNYPRSSVLDDTVYLNKNTAQAIVDQKNSTSQQFWNGHRYIFPYDIQAVDIVSD